MRKTAKTDRLCRLDRLVFERDGREVWHGDCRAWLAAREPGRFSACVTDPPYELGFMGRKWDSSGVSFDPETWRAVLRALRPGAHLVAFGGTRTFHRIACAIEDAGLEIRDCLMWVYGQGFSKSLDVSKAIDKQQRGELVRKKLLHFARLHGRGGKWLEKNGIASAASFADWTVGGHVPSDKNWALVKIALKVTAGEEAAFEREVVAHSTNGIQLRNLGPAGYKDDFDVTAPATPEAARWQGWGTGLKPAWEPIILARKPLDGTVADCVLRHGTGALNVDGCRIGKTSGQGRWPPNAIFQHDARCVLVGTEPSPGYAINRFKDGAKPFGGGAGHEYESERVPAGEREVWACVPGCPVRMLDGQGGVRTSGSRKAGVRKGMGYHGADGDGGPAIEGSSGSISRFFYCPKANTSERRAGLSMLEANLHPTVKPVALMEWLLRLVAPPGGEVLDPFAGSGSTLVAAKRLGVRAVGIDLDAEACDVAAARLTRRTASGVVKTKKLRLGKRRRKKR